MTGVQTCALPILDGTRACGWIGEHGREFCPLPCHASSIEIIHQRGDREVRTLRPEVAQYLGLPGWVIDAHGAIGTCQVQPLRDQLVETGQVMFQRGQAGIIPVNIEAQQFRRVGGGSRSGAR